MNIEGAVGALLLKQKRTLAVAESCTGGLISNRITNIPGSSEYFSGGLITYSNEAKVALLGVSKKTLDRFGAVSEQTVLEMAAGARQRLYTDYAISVSGIAGPGGGSVEKPVGLVWIALCGNNLEIAKSFIFTGDRLEVKQQSAEQALQMLFTSLKNLFEKV
jgi:PncC family amidohydrolase